MSIAGCADIETLSIGETKKPAHNTATEHPEFTLLQGMVFSPLECPVNDIVIGASAFWCGIQVEMPIDALVNVRTANTIRNLRRTRPIILQAYHCVSDLQSNLPSAESLSNADYRQSLILGSCFYQCRRS